MDVNHDGAMWRTSTYSNGSGGNCVEVSADASEVMVRDTQDRTGATLMIGPDAWQRFAAKIKQKDTT